MTGRQTIEQVEQVLVQAIGNRRLSAVCREILAGGGTRVEPAALELVQQALTTCQMIGEHNMVEQRSLVQSLTQAGVQVTNYDADRAAWSMQIHSFKIDTTWEDIDAALKVFEDAGFLHWSPKTGAAWQAFKRFNHAMDFIKVDEVTTRMICSWGEPRPTPKLSRIYRPSTVDMQWINLPDALWPLYYLIRPMRILIDVLNQRKWPILGPFLGTPIDLIDPLLEFANVTEKDMVFDLGCGDGRIIIESARLRGCRGVGIEQHIELVDIGKERAATAGLSNNVQFVHGDASVADLKNATVVFLFLPTTAIGELLPTILSQLKPGARIVAHEQVPIEFGIKPNRTKPIITNSAVTVAHIWEV